MKALIRILLSTLLILNFFLVGCDQGAILVDEVELEVYNDSLRVFKNIPDSAHLIFTTTTDWNISVARGGDWCKLSSSSGSKGKNSITVTVDENSSVSMRQTSIILVSGNVMRIFKVKQEAGEYWFDTFYWDRTSVQKIGLRRKVKSVSLANNNNLYNETYFFDENGNLVKHEYIGLGFFKNDTTRIYEYDSDNHRVECIVLNHDSAVVREYGYEYGNKGSYVAYDQNGWIDENPLSENFSGSVVPDLSASHKKWNEGEFRMGQDRFYSFDSSGRLIIINVEWKHRLDNPDDSIVMQRDTVRIEYRSGLPYTSRKVKNTVYYKNGMVRMLEKNDCKYEFLENSQRMVISSYIYTGTEAQDKDIEHYNITYNYNRDILEREVKYHGYDIVVDRYSKYEYDLSDNWAIREEKIMYPGNSEPVSYYAHRDITYY